MSDYEAACPNEHSVWWGARYCGECGTPCINKAKVCGWCGGKLTLPTNFCTKCGMSVHKQQKSLLGLLLGLFKWR